MNEQWKMVPVEPTEKMLREIQLIEGFTGTALAARYRAMLAAAPVPPAGDVEVAGYRYRSLPDDWELMDESPFPDGRAFWSFGKETLEPVYSSAHVTRLTAELTLERTRADFAVADCNDAEAAGRKVSQLLSERTAERDGLLAEVKRLDLKVSEYDYAFDSQQSELTKAREAMLDVISDLGEFCCALDSQEQVDYITSQLDKLARNAYESCGQDAEVAKGGQS